MTEAPALVELPGLCVAVRAIVSAREYRWRGNADRASAHFGIDLDLSPGRSHGSVPRTIWLAPGTVLVLDQLEPMLAPVPGPWLAVDVGSAYVGFRVKGDRACDYLAKGCTLDFDGPLFGIDRSAGTRFAQLHVIVDQVGADAFDLFLDPGYKRWFEAWLRDAAIEFGATVT